MRLADREVLGHLRMEHAFVAPPQCAIKLYQNFHGATRCAEGRLCGFVIWRLNSSKYIEGADHGISMCKKHLNVTLSKYFRREVR
jgi:hypothetical protein